ncbi:cytochrome P450 [Kitasatospora sp. NPDC057223]|uniref:cytochrome P450 n=1 Tax=Kitasatospora sp. NPDC057223 TaxID=3346055 RepID=UPI003642063A
MARADEPTASFSLGSPPGAWPALGHTLALARDPLAFIASLPAHGDLVRVRIGPRPLYVACHPDIVRHILMTPRVFDKGGPLYETGRTVLGNGLATCTWPDHRRQRPLLQPAFQPARIEQHTATMVRAAQTRTASWTAGARIDVGRVMTDLATHVLGTTLVPLDPADEQRVTDALAATMHTLQLRTMLPFSWWHRLPAPGQLRFARAERTLRQVTARVIENHRTNACQGAGMVSLLLAGQDGSTGQAPSDEHLRDQIVTMFVGGVESTANTLAFAFHLLGTHPECERRLHAELDEVLGTRAPTAADLPRLAYTQRVVTETLRMFPPVWFLTRTITAPTQLAGHPLPAGAAVAFSPYLLHRRPDLFPDPDEFDPDRWLTEHAKQTGRRSLLPFGAGNRKCIGDTFALTEIALILATIASHWRLRPLPARALKPLKPQVRTVLSYGPSPMTCEPRRPAPAVEEAS